MVAHVLACTRQLWLGLGLFSIVLSSPTARCCPAYLLRPDRVFDGETMHEGWVVRVKGDKIEAVGPANTVSATGAEVVDLKGTTLMPGLIEGHSHLLLAPL